MGAATQRGGCSAIVAGLATLAATGCVLVMDLNSADYSIKTIDAGADGSATCSAVGTGGSQFSSGNAECDTCVATNCCTETIACYAAGADGAASDCMLFAQCSAACGSSGSMCVDKCAAMHPQGVTPGNALATCALGGCTSCTSL